MNINSNFSQLLFLKRIFVILLSLAFMPPLRSQDIDTNKLKTQVTDMVEAFMKEDYLTLAKYTYPKIVEKMGGADYMATVISKGMENMKANGYTFKSVSVALTPLKAQAGKEIHAIVTQTIVMTVPGGTITSNSSLLAITADSGDHWYFLDTAKLTDIEKIKTIIPNYDPDLKIPAKQPPIFKKE